MPQSRTRKPQKCQEVEKSGQRVPPTKAVVRPSRFWVFYLKDTTYNINERYHIPPNVGIKH